MNIPIIYIRKGFNNSGVQQVDFDSHIDHFSSLHRIHEKNLQNLEKLIKENPTLVADIAAAVLGHLEEKNALRFDIIQWSLEMCKDIILNYGYKISTIEELKRIQDHQGCHAILVTGCQNADILKTRVQSAYDFMKELGFPFKVVLSGLNPAQQKIGSKVRTVNEARAMEAFLQSLKSKHTRSKPPWDTLTVIEEKAYNTITNIEEFFKLRLLEGNRNNYLYVVSSTFHLPRIATTIDQFLKTNPQTKIDSLILVGSENPFGIKRVPSSSRYLKSMLHEIFSTILKKSN